MVASNLNPNDIDVVSLLLTLFYFALFIGEGQQLISAYFSKNKLITYRNGIMFVLFSSAFCRWLVWGKVTLLKAFFVNETLMMVLYFLPVWLNFCAISLLCVFYCYAMFEGYYGSWPWYLTICINVIFAIFNITIAVVVQTTNNSSNSGNIVYDIYISYAIFLDLFTALVLAYFGYYFNQMHRKRHWFLSLPKSPQTFTSMNLLIVLCFIIRSIMVGLLSSNVFTQSSDNTVQFNHHSGTHHEHDNNLRNYHLFNNHSHHYSRLFTQQISGIQGFSGAYDSLLSYFLENSRAIAQLLSSVFLMNQSNTMGGHSRVMTTVDDDGDNSNYKTSVTILLFYVLTEIVPNLAMFYLLYLPSQNHHTSSNHDHSIDQKHSLLPHGHKQGICSYLCCFFTKNTSNDVSYSGDFHYDSYDYTNVNTIDANTTLNAVDGSTNIHNISYNNYNNSKNNVNNNINNRDSFDEEDETDDAYAYHHQRRRLHNHHNENTHAKSQKNNSFFNYFQSMFTQNTTNNNGTTNHRKSNANKKQKKTKFFYYFEQGQLKKQILSPNNTHNQYSSSKSNSKSKKNTTRNYNHNTNTNLMDGLVDDDGTEEDGEDEEEERISGIIPGRNSEITDRLQGYSSDYYSSSPASNHNFHHINDNDNNNNIVVPQKSPFTTSNNYNYNYHDKNKNSNYHDANSEEDDEDAPDVFMRRGLLQSHEMSPPLLTKNGNNTKNINNNRKMNTKSNHSVQNTANSSNGTNSIWSFIFGTTTITTATNNRRMKNNNSSLFVRKSGTPGLHDGFDHDYDRPHLDEEEEENAHDDDDDDDEDGCDNDADNMMHNMHHHRHKTSTSSNDHDILDNKLPTKSVDEDHAIRVIFEAAPQPLRNPRYHNNNGPKNIHDNVNLNINNNNNNKSGTNVIMIRSAGNTPDIVNTSMNQSLNANGNKVPTNLSRLHMHNTSATNLSRMVTSSSSNNLHHLHNSSSGSIPVRRPSSTTPHLPTTNTNTTTTNNPNYTQNTQNSVGMNPDTRQFLANDNNCDYGNEQNNSYEYVNYAESPVFPDYTPHQLLQLQQREYLLHQQMQLQQYYSTQTSNSNNNILNNSMSGNISRTTTPNIVHHQSITHNNNHGLNSSTIHYTNSHNNQDNEEKDNNTNNNTTSNSDNKKQEPLLQTRLSWSGSMRL